MSKPKIFEDQKQISWHLRTYGHLPSECGSKNPMLDCPIEDEKFCGCGNFKMNESNFCKDCI